MKVARSDSIASSSESSAGHCLEEFMTCTSCWQFDLKHTFLKPRLLSSSMAHSRPSASAWSGDEELIHFLCPRITSNSPSNRVKPKPTPVSSRVHDASNMHLHFSQSLLSWPSPSLSFSGFLSASRIISGRIYASLHASASWLASCRESIGDMSLLLKHFSFRAFHRYHINQGNVDVLSAKLGSCCICNSISKLTKIEVHGKAPRDEGTVDNAQHWTAGGHSKIIWLIVSLSAPHRWHTESVLQCLSFSLLAAAT